MSNSQTINPAVASASVREATLQIRGHLFQPLTRFFAKLTDESKAEGTDFTEQVSKIEDWNQRTVREVVDLTLDYISNRGFALDPCIKTVVMGRTMLLTAFGTESTDSKLSIAIPDKYFFVHSILCNAAEVLKDATQVPTTPGNWTTLFDNAMEQTFLHAIGSASTYTYMQGALLRPVSKIATAVSLVPPPKPVAQAAEDTFSDNEEEHEASKTFEEASAENPEKPAGDGAGFDEEDY